MGISRRRFLRYLGIGIVGLAIPTNLIAEPNGNNYARGVLTDGKWSVQDIIVPMSWDINAVDGETVMAHIRAAKQTMIGSGLPGTQPLPLIYGGRPFDFPPFSNAVVIRERDK